MLKKGFLKKCLLVKGRGLVGWVMGHLFQEYWQHGSDTGRLRGLRIGKVSLSRCTPACFCDDGQVITWNFSFPSVMRRQVLVTASQGGN